MQPPWRSPVVEVVAEIAAHSPGRRPTRPLLVVLDEAATVCRWRKPPKLDSHYGRRGIVIMTTLQS